MSIIATIVDGMATTALAAATLALAERQLLAAVRAGKALLIATGLLKKTRMFPNTPTPNLVKTFYLSLPGRSGNVLKSLCFS